ncbi:MAG: hypothetical protein ACD_15C00060G0004 [uncultured bacterium]|nr:MAG: hypothetical protein ACD_15C00060G0004 [uncultured bacterium]
MEKHFSNSIGRVQGQKRCHMKKYTLVLMFFMFFVPSFASSHDYDRNEYYDSRDYRNQRNRSYYGCYPYCKSLDRGGDYFRGLTPDSSWLQRPRYYDREYRKDRYGEGRDWRRDRERQRDHGDRRYSRKYGDRH